MASGLRRIFQSGSGGAHRPRAVHLKIYPIPRNLRESREVLRVLQKFGTVEMFKSLRFDYNSPAPNSAIAIFKEASAAEELRGASPLRFALDVGAEVEDESGIGFEEVVTAEEGWKRNGKAQGEDRNGTGSGHGGRYGREGEWLGAPIDSADRPRIGKSGAEEMIRIEYPLPKRDPAEIAKEEAADGGDERARRRRTGILGAIHAANQITGEPLIYPPSSHPPPPPPPRTGFPSDISPPSNANAPPGSDADPESRYDYDTGQTVPPDDNGSAAPRRSMREFHLTADISLMNHQDILERQSYYGEFRLLKTPMQDDLANLVPIRGLSEAHIGLATVNGNILYRRREEARARPTVMQVWEEAERRRREGKDVEEHLRKGQRDPFVPASGMEAKKKRFGHQLF